MIIYVHPFSALWVNFFVRYFKFDSHAQIKAINIESKELLIIGFSHCTFIASFFAAYRVSETEKNRDLHILSLSSGFFASNFVLQLKLKLNTPHEKFHFRY